MTSRLSRLSLSLRGRLPDSVRRFARFARHIVRKGQPSPGIPPELLAECRVCASRYELVKSLPKQARVAEVGTYRGEFARHILAASDPAELHLIDIEMSLLDPDVAKDSAVLIHRGRSQDMLARFP